MARLRRWCVAFLTLLGVGFFLVPSLLVTSAPERAETTTTLPPVAPAWPMFGGSPRRNMVNCSDRNIPIDWSVAWSEGPGLKTVDLSKSMNVKWVAKLGTRAYGQPVIADGKVFVGTTNHVPRDPKVKGDRGILMCFRTADGEFLWQAVHDKLAGGMVNDWPNQGIASSPAVVGNRLYYVSNRCELVCAATEARNGTKEADIHWTLDMMKALGVFPHNLSPCSPLVVGDRVFVVTANGIEEDHRTVSAPEAPSFLAVDRWTGRVLWMDNSPGKNIMHGQWSNPTHAVAAGEEMVIFPGGDGWLRGFVPATGQLLWKFDANPKDARYLLGGKGTRSDFIATPVVHDGRLYIGTGQDPEHYEGVGHLWCIDLSRRGDVSPQLVTDDTVFPPRTKPNPNSAAIWHYGGKVPAADKAKVGREYYFGRTMSTVAVQDGLVYAAELAGYLHCLDARTGEAYWTQDLKAAIWGSPYWVDGKVYLATEDGDVWTFKHGKEKKVLNKVEMDQPTRGTPVVVDGVLYVMTESHLYAITAK